jgi:hypothetical protein
MTDENEILRCAQDDTAVESITPDWRDLSEEWQGG